MLLKFSSLVSPLTTRPPENVKLRMYLHIFLQDRASLEGKFLEICASNDRVLPLYTEYLFLFLLVSTCKLA